MDDALKDRIYDGNNYNVNDSVGFLMRQIVAISSQAIEERMASHGLTDAQWKPLLMIGQGHCKTAAELARHGCSDTGATTRLLDRVEAKGLVRRSRSQSDRRVVNLELTDEGQQLAEVVPHILADVLNTILAGFSKEEAQQLQTLLRRVLDNARRLREDDAART